MVPSEKTDPPKGRGIAFEACRNDPERSRAHHDDDPRQRSRRSNRVWRRYFDRPGGHQWLHQRPAGICRPLPLSRDDGVHQGTQHRDKGTQRLLRGIFAPRWWFLGESRHRSRLRQGRRSHWPCRSGKHDPSMRPGESRNPSTRSGRRRRLEWLVFRIHEAMPDLRA
jgi:hypothetical protein